MQLEHVARARGLVQAVDVLGDDRAHSPRRCSAATARCPALGAAAANRRQPTKLRAQ